MQGHVESLGGDAQKHALKLKGEGMALSLITQELNEKYNADLKERTVKEFFQRSRNKSFQILKEDKNFQTKLAQTYFNTLEQINRLNKEVWSFFYEIKKTPEIKDKIVKCGHCGRRIVLQYQSYGLLLKAADHILKQIEHIDKVLGRMKDRSLTLNYNFVDLSKKLVYVLPQLFHDAERKGIIKILSRKRLKEIKS